MQLVQHGSLDPWFVSSSPTVCVKDYFKNESEKKRKRESLKHQSCSQGAQNQPQESPQVWKHKEECLLPGE